VATSVSDSSVWRVRAVSAPSARRMTVATIAVCGLLVLSVLGAGGTSAFLTSGASAAPGSTVITSGTADLTLTALSLPGTLFYPGLTLYGAVTATNNGNVPVSIGVSGLTAPTSTANALSQALVIGVGAAASGDAASTAECTAGSVVPGWTGTFASATAGQIGATLPVGASRVLCVSVTLPVTAPTSAQGQTATGFRLRVIGTQA
jgi:hypothetical protein